MKISQFQIFKLVADFGSFSSAAAEMGCTQSNVSHSISQVERFVGERLFTRNRYGCQLTEAGAEFSIKLNCMFEILEQMQGRQVITRPVRIAALRSITAGLLSPLLSGKNNPFEGIELEICDVNENGQGLTEMLDEQRVDIAIGDLPCPEKYTTRPFLVDSYVAILPSGIETAGELKSEQLAKLHYIKHNNNCQFDVTSFMHSSKQDIKAHMQCDSIDTVIAMVEGRAGFSIVPRLALPRHSCSYQIVRLPQGSKRQIYILSRPYSMMTLKVRNVFETFLNSNVFRICNQQKPQELRSTLISNMR